ncbi:hypothetical protein CA238_03465 [Sphingomonas koreensis]|jgi:hypothetical protein|uniref:Uncharacterized protein n=2 Tax=Sphingomonas koreensis TaxID=93064 RepID=A0A1L6JBY4_9SPHN|nr:hypothetical protein [Sphingomonas koreensis]APR53415.1 hypothetical protein BRX40_14120 [Sphingomonas koreensis]MDC7809897.1 hypothetical protein [Sphingomonas koreensis]PJI86921.1 hypothetical protein BDW16_0145 [Sphingomonas koreensis]RSU25105.1 hypothetical protein CA222_13310 [Sphingomonas koreensis]RSU37343.1 hypothetical protein BRX39_05485 [Sphingomonas koreensis]
MRISRLATAAMLWAGLAASSAASGQSARPCLTGNEAEALFQVMLPDMIREMGRVCTALPANAFLRQPSAAFMARINAGVAPAMPAAQGGIRKLLGPDAGFIAESQFAIPAVRAIIAPAIAQEVKPADCPGLDKIVTNLAPLPPRNLAGVFAALLQLSQNDEKRAPRLPICPMGRPR